MNKIVISVVCTGQCLSSDSDSDGLEVGGVRANRSGRVKRKTLASSSGSDVAMHEGNDLSDDDHTGKTLIITAENRK